MRASDLHLVVMDGQTAALHLAHPCPCDQPRCRTIGEHVLQATRDFTPGPRAQSFEPSTAPTIMVLEVDHITVDPTVSIDEHFDRLVQTYWDAARDLTREISRLRPDRWVELPEPASDERWCRNHLDTIGQCYERYRGDLCRDCYELSLAYGQVPDRQFLDTVHDRGYKRDIDVKDWLTRIPKTPKRKRKKA